jgi:hypothetical protein
LREVRLLRPPVAACVRVAGLAKRVRTGLHHRRRLVPTEVRMVSYHRWRLVLTGARMVLRGQGGR